MVPSILRGGQARALESAAATKALEVVNALDVERPAWDGFGAGFLVLFAGFSMSLDVADELPMILMDLGWVFNWVGLGKMFGR